MADGLKLDGATVLVTGANRGIGRALVRAALRRGARKVWAGMRRPEDPGLPGVEAVELDVTDAAQVRAAAARCSDVDLLVNNAGIAEQGGVLPAGSEEALRRHLEVNLFGIQRMAPAFGPGTPAGALNATLPGGAEPDRTPWLSRDLRTVVFGRSTSSNWTRINIATR